jgi:4-diphosphocytidyl-2-C-methyl-D-erythritol kinase
MAVTELVVEARAKINLALAVTGRRDDGYHLLDTLMASVSVSDTLRLRLTGGGVTLRVRGDAPADRSNLALRAARLLEPLGGGRGVSMELIKSIPAGAGMGGGSADAAAALAGLNRLWNLGLSCGDLRARALGLGADVPFMLEGGLARCRGVGERVAPLPFRLLHLVLVMGPTPLSTDRVYEAFDAMSGGAEENTGAIEAAEAALRRRDTAALAGLLGNALERPAGRLGLDVEAVRRDILDSGALAARMTGSGAAFFGIYAGPAEADAARERLAVRYPYCRTAVTRPEGLAFSR